MDEKKVGDIIADVHSHLITIGEATRKIMELIKQDQEARCDICYGEKK